MRSFLMGAVIAGVFLVAPGAMPAGRAWAETKTGAQRQTAGERMTEVSTLIFRSVRENWVFPSDLAAFPVVRIRFNLKPDGSLDGKPVVEKPADDPAFETLSKSAIRAIHRTAPFALDGYQDLYDEWKTVTIRFDASAR